MASPAGDTADFDGASAGEDVVGIDSAPDQRFLPSGDEAGTAPEDRPFRPDVEGLRAVAVLLVVLFHIGFSSFSGGFFGVDVFFVISGFVITGLLLRERRKSGHTDFLYFYARRARRILPAALLVMMVSLFLAFVLVGHSYSELVASDSRWTALFLSNFHFATVYPTLLATRAASPLQPYWSLAVEEQFYLIYPAIFVAVLAFPGRRSLRSRLTIALIGVIVVSFAYSVGTSKIGQLGAYDSPFTRAWELALGALLAVVTLKLERIPKVVAAAMTWIGLGLVLVVAMTVTVKAALPGTITALPVIGAGLIIAGGCAAPLWGVESVLRLWPFRWIGRWSYSWYLWHWPVMLLAALRTHTTVNTTSTGRNSLLALVALLLAAATYFLVENPIRHSRWLAKQPGLTLVGAGLFIASCVAFTFAF
jgi:peptidoglycan/LPS O-acetylase OafA/YrhL